MINRVILVGILESENVIVCGNKIKKTYLKIATQNYRKTKVVTIPIVVYLPLLNKLLNKKNVDFLKNNFCSYYGYLALDKKHNIQVIINDIVFVAKGDEFLNARANP